MPERSIDRVTIELPSSEALYTISWDARNDLLERASQTPHIEDAAALIKEFKRHGTSSPVPLDKAEARDLYELVTGWVLDVGHDQLPDGIPTLADALADEFEAGGSVQTSTEGGSGRE
jgi:hypothetical protein